MMEYVDTVTFADTVKERVTVTLFAASCSVYTSNRVCSSVPVVAAVNTLLDTSLCI